MRLAIDSSVLAKLFVQESDSDRAVELILASYHEEIDLIASDLAISEVGRVIARIANKNAPASSHISKLFSMDIEFKRLDKHVSVDAMGIAGSRNVTFYDAVHVATALAHDSFLVTEDKRLLKEFEEAQDMKEAIVHIT